MEKTEFIKKLLEQSKEFGFDESEAYYQKGKAFQVQIQDQAIHQYENHIEQGICFRGMINNQMGYAYCERFDEKAIDFLLSQAKQNAEIMSGETEFLYEGDASYPDFSKGSKEKQPIESHQIISDAKQMERSAKEESNFIKMAETCFVSHNEEEITIVNTKGLHVESKDEIYTAYISSIADNKNDIKLSDEFWMGRNYASFSPDAIGRLASSEAVKHLGAKSIPSGSYAVILKNLTFCDLLARFAGIFFAENTQKGFSLLGDKVGGKIASSLITLRDDGYLEQGLTHASFDSEGVSTKQKVIIEKGVLKTLLHNLKTAKLAGVSSTGNGFKPSLQSPIQTSCTNFYIENGALDLPDLLKEMDTGVLITSIAGLHSGANPISGDFSLSAEGFFIEGGENKFPIEQITIAGNFYQCLKDISGVGNDLRFQPSDGVSCIGSPAILIKNLSLSGL